MRLICLFAALLLALPASAFPSTGSLGGGSIARTASTAAQLAACFSNLPASLAEGFGVSCKLLGPGPITTTTGISVAIPATGGVGGSFYLDLNGQTIIGSGTTHDVDVLRLDMSASDANHFVTFGNGEIRYIGTGFNVMGFRLIPGTVTSHTNVYISDWQYNRHTAAPQSIGIGCCTRFDADGSGIRFLISNSWIAGGGGGDLFTASVTQLAGALSSGATTINVDSTAGMPSRGEACIDLAGTPECIYYSSKNATQLLGVTRGYDGTTAAAHNDNDQVDIFGGSNAFQLHSSGGAHLSSLRISSDAEQHGDLQRCLFVSNASGNATIEGQFFASSCNGFDFGTANVKVAITGTRIGQVDLATGDGNQTAANHIIVVGPGSDGGFSEVDFGYDWLSAGIGSTTNNLFGLREGASLNAYVTVEDADSSKVCPPWITTGSVIDALQTTGTSPTQIDLTTSVATVKQANGCAPSTTAGAGGILSANAATFLNLPSAANNATVLRYRNVAEGDYLGNADATDNAYVVRRISYDQTTTFSSLGTCGDVNRGSERWITDGNAAGAECDAGGGTARELCRCGAGAAWVAAP
jgi:hypothetical protein